MTNVRGSRGAIIIPEFSSSPRLEDGHGINITIANFQKMKGEGAKESSSPVPSKEAVPNKPQEGGQGKENSSRVPGKEEVPGKHKEGGVGAGKENNRAKGARAKGGGAKGGAHLQPTITSALTTPPPAATQGQGVGASSPPQRLPPNSAVRLSKKVLPPSPLVKANLAVGQEEEAWSETQLGEEAQVRCH